MSTLSNQMERNSFAKINLYLEIVGKDQKNYHLLDSLMALIDIKDKIIFEESNALSFEIKGSAEFLLNENWQDNIIIKTVKLLSEKYGFNPKLKITLEKNIPVAAGLGGGSSNAATTLLMLDEFYNLKLSKEELLKHALTLGADVPFFINGKMAIATGVGEILEPVAFDAKNVFLLIVNPKKPLITAKVFAEFSKTHLTFQSSVHAKDPDLIHFIKNRQNDLQHAAMLLMPEVFEILEEMKNQQNCEIARMSGSGATCFGIFKTKEDQELAYQTFTKLFPQFYIQKSVII